MIGIGELFRTVQEVAQTVRLLANGLIRIGKVHSVDPVECVIVVEYLHLAADGQPHRSLPMPWLQRSTEHRPPAVGDHAVVLDPSLGNGGAIAITGWTSTARPVPGGAGDYHAIFVTPDGQDGDSYGDGVRTIKAPSVIVHSPDIELGESPTDYASLATRVDEEIGRIWDVLTDASVIPAPSAPPDAGEPGLLTLKTLAGTASALVQSVAAAQVKIK